MAPAVQQCEATAKSTGKRCRRPAAPGSSTCTQHHGASPHWHRTREVLALTFIERYRDMYERSHNVKHAYSAYDAARKAGVRPPDWVQAVMDEAAETVHTTAEDGSTSELARALGIRGTRGHTVGAMAATDLRHDEIRTYVKLRRKRHRDLEAASPVDKALEEAAEAFGLAFDTVRDIYYRDKGSK